MAARINYKMSKLNKIMLSRIPDPHFRGEVRRLIVAADVHAMTVPKTNPLDKEKKSRSNVTEAVPTVK
jgi:hypothetical protein